MLQLGYLHSSHRYASRSAWLLGWSSCCKGASDFVPQLLHGGNALVVQVGHVLAVPGSSCLFLHVRFCDSFMSASHAEQAGYRHVLQRKASLSSFELCASFVFRCAVGFWPQWEHVGNWQSRQRTLAVAVHSWLLKIFFYQDMLNLSSCS